MTFRFILGLAALSAAQLAAATTSAAQPPAEAIRQSANKAAAIMQKSMAATVLNVPCASCHHNTMPLWTMAMARQRGVKIDATLERQVAARTYSFLADVDRAIQGSRFVDPTLEGAQLLAFGKSVGVTPSVSTTLHTRRLAGMQRQDGTWVSFDMRPPASSSLFMTTALSAKAVMDFAPEIAGPHVEKARAWMSRTQPISVEDASFRLLGLHWMKASNKEIKAAADALLAMRQADGAWGQVKGRAADAYATGEAIAALRLAGVKADVSRGVAFLVKTQAEDGSWLVKTRLHEVAPISPPYMETGFPYGKDQIVSMAGTTWAMLALSLQLPEADNVAALPELTEARPVDVPAWVEAAAFGDVSAVADVNASTAKGSTPLMTAAGDLARVKALVARGADARARAKNGWSTLAVAAVYNGSAPVLRFLIDNGADAKPFKPVEFNANPVVYAAFNGDVEAVRVLLDNGASFKQGMLLQGLVPMSPATAAVSTNSVEVVRELLKRGMDPNLVDNIPLLSIAAMANRDEVVKVLLAAGADPKVRDRYRWTARQHATAGIEHDVNRVEALLPAAQE
jgi:N-acyl-D-amino-acid deacylase